MEFSEWVETLIQKQFDGRGAGLARAAEVSHTAVSKWRNGKAKPDAPQVQRLAAIADMHEQDVWAMLGGRPLPHYGDAVARALNLPPDLTVQEARYLHLAHAAFRTWQREFLREPETAQSGERPA